MIDKPYHYYATVTKVVDGDTIDARVEYGFHGTLELRFRIYSDDPDTYFDTPETRRYRGVNEEHVKHGLEAKNRAIELLLNKKVILKTYKEGSFRWLAEVFYEDSLGEWKNYTETMISEGYQKRLEY
jgi:micrococcal nuclease